MDGPPLPAPGTGERPVPWISGDRLERLLPPAAAIEAVEAALRAERSGQTLTPLRGRLESAGTVLMTMPTSSPEHLGIKVLTLADGNRDRGLPTIQGVVLVFGTADGRLQGVVDGPALTARRTAAVAGWATDRLADPAARHLVLVGAGAQAAHQAEAVCAVRPIERISCWNRTPERAERLAAELRARHPSLRVTAVADLCRATRSADVVTLVTGAREPLLSRRDLPHRCHVNAIGAHGPQDRELASDVVAAAAVYADTVAGCLAEAGDVLIPIAEGRLTRRGVRRLADARPGAEGLTVMKSVGSAVFDLACAALVLQRAAADGAPDPDPQP